MVYWACADCGKKAKNEHLPNHWTFSSYVRCPKCSVKHDMREALKAEVAELKRRGKL